MGRRIVSVIFLLAFLVIGYLIWQHYNAQKQIADGAVTCQGCMTPDEKARFDKENSGDTPDGQSEHKDRTARQDIDGQSAVMPPMTPTGTTTTSANLTAPAANSLTPATPAPGSYPVTSGGAPAGGPLPTSDSQIPNAPNNLHFGGSGAYQWYRQGNITYRVDTVSGSSCIAYATLEEWRKQIVYSHGCGRGA
jgi:hypothetical protein